MNLDFWKTLKPLEIVLILVFIVYIVFAIPTPTPFIPLIQSSLGLGMVVLLVIYMAFYTNPILAILSVLVGYELLRRSSVITEKAIPLQKYVPTQQNKNIVLQEMNPVQKFTLEEEVIKKMAPIGETADATMFIETSYVPLPDKNLDCSAYYSCN